MDFRLAFTPTPFREKIRHQHQLMLMGSCFTENIGDKLMAHKFSVLQNPHGILFNPVSVANALEDYISCKEYRQHDLFYLNEAWHSWKHHSRYSSPYYAESIYKINQSISEAHQYLKNCDWLIITLGSAWVYELTSTATGYKEGAVAANNHKAPANWFNRKLMQSNELTVLLQKMINSLKDFNAALKIIFTISPVRHIREGFIENNRSKALLHTSVHEIVDNNSNTFYFPAYELVIDDLRDYRFFAEDMVHPNYAATNYVWEKFVSTCMDQPTKQLMDAINEINAAYAHKPFNAESNAHAKFKQSYLEKIDRIESENPYLNFDKERAYFS